MHNVAEVGDCSNLGRDVQQDEDRKHGTVVVEMAAAVHVESMDDDEGRQEDNNHNAVVVVAVGVSLVEPVAGTVTLNALEC